MGELEDQLERRDEQVGDLKQQLAVRAISGCNGRSSAELLDAAPSTPRSGTRKLNSPSAYSSPRIRALLRSGHMSELLWPEERADHASSLLDNGLASEEDVETLLESELELAQERLQHLRTGLTPSTSNRGRPLGAPSMSAR